MGLLENENYCKIISENHYQRIGKLLDESKGEIVIGGKRDDAKNKIEVTVLTSVKEDDSLMKTEIFGPVLPILTVESREEAVDFINARSNPLALYSFTGNSDNTKYRSCFLLVYISLLNRSFQFRSTLVRDLAFKTTFSFSSSVSPSFLLLLHDVLAGLGGSSTDGIDFSPGIAIRWKRRIRNGKLPRQELFRHLLASSYVLSYRAGSS